MTLGTTDVLFKTQLKLCSFSACGEYQQVTDNNNDEDGLEDGDENCKDGYGTAGLEGGMMQRRIEHTIQTPYGSTTAPAAGTPAPTNIAFFRPTHGSYRPYFCTSPHFLVGEHECRTRSTFYSTTDATTTRALMGNVTMERMHPTTLVCPHYCARRWDPPPRPTSTSPALSRTHMDPMSMHLPLFEWGNMAMDSVFSTDPAITRRPLPTPIPALSNVPPVFQASPLAQNPTTPVFNTGESHPPPFLQPTSGLWSPQRQMTVAFDERYARPPFPTVCKAAQCLHAA
ncbi:hypothetical protein EDD18DRAFT_1108341 [Armillaria luteobubalina]|uniref:Uncharacterized protein n=1 Tax=Armillaria luteobubalina TaxID=153913 RepID=A0AA39Q0Q3_9AGAR|nr:hypothetical protein EDD18DRAFT_1108341 [Armillaria luteobubalina]